MLLAKKFNHEGEWLFRYRSYLPILLLIPGLILYLVSEMNQENTLAQEWWYVYSCLVISLIGLVIRILTVGCTPDHTSGRNTKEQGAASLNTTGIYSIVRNPLYLGNFFIWLGVGLLCHNIWFIIIFCFLFMFFYERIIFTEEKFLKKKFGKKYRNWANRTPVFIPKFNGFRKSVVPFSWKKVLRKEKNGFGAIFVVFCGFNVLGKLVRGEREFDVFLIGMAAFSFLFYFLIKYLKYNTKILIDKNRY